MPDYAPSYGRPQNQSYLAGAQITGGQLLMFSGADTVIPATGPTLLFAGIAGEDVSTGAMVTVHAGAGVVHETAAAGTLTAPAAAPVPTTAASGGTVAAGVYGVETTYVNSSGETVASAAGTVTAAGGSSTITIPSPPAQAGAVSWFAYVTQAGGAVYTRQQASGSPTAIGTPLVLTAPPTSSGANPPASNSTGLQPGELVAASAGGQISGGATPGQELGVATRSMNSAGLVRWKTTKG